jgi:hypothetical protein
MVMYKTAGQQSVIERITVHSHELRARANNSGVAEATADIARKARACPPSRIRWGPPTHPAANPIKYPVPRHPISNVENASKLARTGINVP